MNKALLAVISAAFALSLGVSAEAATMAKKPAMGMAKHQMMMTSAHQKCMKWRMANSKADTAQADKYCKNRKDHPRKMTKMMKTAM